MMRKFFVALLVGAVAVGLAAPAFAADLKFTGAYRLRFQFDKALDCFNSTPAGGLQTKCDGHLFDTRFRPRFDVETDGGVKGVIRLEIGDLVFGETSRVGSGSAGGAGNDAVNVETKWAYIDFPIPATPLRLQGGLQGFATSKGLLLADDGPGFTLYGKLGEVDVKAWWMRANDRTVFAASANTARGSLPDQGVGPNGEDARDLYALDLTYSPMKDLNLNAYLIYDHDMETTLLLGKPATGFWVGVGASGKVQNIRWDLDYIHGSKETLIAGVESKKKGWVVDGGAGMALPGTPLDLEVRAWYATGDKQNGGDNEGFPVLSRGFNPNRSPSPSHDTGAQIWGNGGVIDVNELADSPENTWGIGLIARYTVSPTLKVSGNIHYIGVQEQGTVAGGGSPAGNGFISGVDSIGTDIGIRADYTIAKGLVFTVVASRLFLGDDVSITGTRFEDVSMLAGILNYGF